MTKSKATRIMIIDQLIESRARLDVAKKLDDVQIVDYLREHMIKSIMGTYEIDHVAATYFYNDIVKGIDHVHTKAQCG